MNETQGPPTTGADARERLIRARRRHEEAEQALRLARNRVRIIDNDVRDLRAQRDNTAEVGHRGADLMQDAAERRFQAELRGYIAQLRLVEAGAADPPSPELIAAYVTARLGGEFFAALHGAVDAAVDDDSIPAFSGGVTVAEVDAAISAKRDERRAAEVEAEQAEAEVAAAKVEVAAAKVEVEEAQEDRRR